MPDDDRDKVLNAIRTQDLGTRLPDRLLCGCTQCGPQPCWISGVWTSATWVRALRRPPGRRTTSSRSPSTSRRKPTSMCVCLSKSAGKADKHAQAPWLDKSQ